MQKGVGDGEKIGMKLFRRVCLITVLVIALTKVEGGLRETWGDVRLKKVAHGKMFEAPALSHDDETSPRTCLGQWGLSGNRIEQCF